MKQTTPTMTLLNGTWKSWDTNTRGTLMGAWKYIEAVNHVLQAGGEAPVNSLTEDSASAVSIVDAMLKEDRLAVLTRGQLFNTRYPYMEPNTDKHILLGDSVLSIDGWQEDAITQFTIVDGKLFDVTNQTDEFDTNVHLKILFDANFEDMTTTLQFQVMASTAKSFQRRYQQDQITDVDLVEKEAEAVVRSTEEELRGSNIDPKSKTPLGRVLNSGVFGYD